MAYTVVDPWTVVVHLQHAALANTGSNASMTAAWRSMWFQGQSPSKIQDECLETLGLPEDAAQPAMVGPVWFAQLTPPARPEHGTPCIHNGSAKKRARNTCHHDFAPHSLGRAALPDSIMLA
eukprot:1307679-Amphidinium_carterae.1